MSAIRTPPRRRIFGLDVDVIGPADTVAQIMAWCGEERAGNLVVTPNLDHALKVTQDAALRQAYAGARLVVPDGTPLVWMSRLDGGARLRLVTGSDLIHPVCAAAAQEGRTVFLLGSRDTVLERAAAELLARHPGLRLVGTHAPPMAFERSEEAQREAVARVRAAGTDILLVALGSPKQEVWSARFGEASGARAILCIGAGLDFVAGAMPRAPNAFRRLGAEWLWRIASEPRRLGGRYLRIMGALPGMTLRHLAEQRAAGRKT